MYLSSKNYSVYQAIDWNLNFVLKYIRKEIIFIYICVIVLIFLNTFFHHFGNKNKKNQKY